jgi:hypothetical protein
MAASLAVLMVSATGASASIRSTTTAYYGSVYKDHSVWWDYGGRYLVNQSNYETKNGGGRYLMLQGSTVQVWSGGKYFVLDAYHDWLPSGRWTIQFKDWVYRKDTSTGKWVFVKIVYSKVWK